MLKTDRTHLRNLEPGDASEMLCYRNDPRCSRYQRYNGNGMEYLRNFVKEYSACRFLSLESEQHYAAVCSADEKMLGDISIYYSEKDNCFTLGITVSPAYQSKGYGFELMSAVTSKLAQRYPSVDLVALIEPDNSKSIALFKKLGFAEECYAKSVESYVFVKYGNNGHTSP